MHTTITTLRPRSLTPEPLLLNTERLHRVDASQLPHGIGVSLGHCRTDAPHTEPEVPQSERDHALQRKVMATYAAGLILCAWGTWQLFTH